MARRSLAKRHPSLRGRLRRVLALSLASPLAVAGACHETTEPSPLDAGSSPIVDASRDSSMPPYDASADADDGSACAPISMEAGLFGEDGSCGHFVFLPCGIPPALPVEGCFPSVDLCTAVCPEKFFITCQFPAPTCEDAGVAPDASIYLDCSTCLGNIGRRPVGLVTPRQGRGRSPLGRYFSLAAHLERASVDAFQQLRARLMSFGAPASLGRRALRAASDERRHARVLGRLARRHSGELPPATRCTKAPLDFEAFVLENAVEGCVRETFGAVLAMHQAARASNPRVRATMRRVAADETRHAELALAIHRWAMARLSAGGRLRVRQAQTGALAEMRAGAGAWHPDVVRVAGMPEPRVEAALIDAFGDEMSSLFIA